MPELSSKYLINCLFLALALSLTSPCLAASHDIRIPLRDGKLHYADLSNALLADTHLPLLAHSPLSFKGGLDLNSFAGSLFVRALNASLGDGCRLTMMPDGLALHFDAEKLPSGMAGARDALRTFTAVAAPQATAAQDRELGLLLPNAIDVHKPLVVLIHGLDADRTIWTSMATLLEQQGYQVATFDYLGDAHIAQSAALLAGQMTALRDTFPGLRIDMICHSMGSLVARSYVEGPQYAGGVAHLIMLAPPNHGSTWTPLEPLLEMHEQYTLWRHDPNWHWTWAITEGLGQAAADLKPDSAFLKTLNALPRRAGVQYSIIAGDQSLLARQAADCVEAPTRCIPQAVGDFWGLRQCRAGLEHAADSLRNRQSTGDGPVSLASARLDGVDDFVVVRADHCDLLDASETNAPPAAWAIIRDRLAN